jgi:hypothetical protein
VKVWPASGSVALTLPTAVPLGLFSFTPNAASASVGASFWSVTVIVMAAVSESAPPSVTVTTRLYGEFASTGAAAVEITPVAGSMLKALPVLPAVIAKVSVALSEAGVSGSVATTVVTEVPIGAFSATAATPSLAVGASLTSVIVIVTVVESESGTPPSSVAVTVRVKLGVASKSTAAWLATVIWPAASIANAPPVLPPVMA